MTIHDQCASDVDISLSPMSFVHDDSSAGQHYSVVADKQSHIAVPIEGAERFRLLFEQAALGIAYLALDGTWLEVNQKICSIVGYSRPELLAQNSQTMTFPDDLEAERASLQRLLNAEIPSYALEKRLFCKDGSLIWVNCTVSLVRDKDWSPVHCIAIVEDISARKKVEEERTSLLLHEQEALRTANLRMEEFLGIASHELRTPLTTIKANVQLALRRIKSLLGHPSSPTEEVSSKLDATQEMLLRAERQIGVLNRLVSDMIDISRIQRSKLQVYIRQEPCDLLEIVQEGVQEQRKAVPARTIELKLSTLTSVPVMADPDRIGQVLTNYISNALKYSEATKPVLVDVELCEGEPFARVSVCDEGTGLSPEDQSRVWECFYQAQGVRVLSGSGVGLGLGLYISKTIIERHAGSVGIDSALDRGSTFWFTLPVAQVTL